MLGRINSCSHKSSQVLSNEERRNIYDIYGRQGLESGLEVGEHLRGHDELKREFERFRADQV